ncbi:alpha-keto acid decarboxylase family protein [Streptomyces sp. NPDC020379]|uniref:alpha-keto acid decarboxylase family protein n=1 Tax=Streptomyces sp. NPDC020379 TaxID=3365071 RepID=UPI0037BD2D20
MTTPTVAEYLLNRLAELGIDHIFGVPGDFNLGFLDQVTAAKGMTWVGNCNELNAGYAADGYARVRGAGAVLSTFGVGELSLVNAVAGSYAESVPVVAISGMPATGAAASGKPLHHTLGDGDYQHFSRMFAEITVAHTTLTADNAAPEIDRVLGELMHHKRPVHINLPTDVVTAPCPAPASPLPAAGDAAADPARLEEFLAHCARLLGPARTVTVLAGHHIDRCHLRTALAGLVEAGGTGMRTAAFSLGKSTVDETGPAFAGIYTGALSDESTRKAVEDTECLILAGAEITDIDTGGFTHHFDATPTIALHPDHAEAGPTRYDHLPLARALDGLTRLLRARPGLRPEARPTPARESSPVTADGGGPLTQKAFWQRLSAALEPGDILIADLGTASFGAQELRLPAGVRFICQTLWASIGYSLPAAFGAQLAAPGRRCVLVIGDGALQLTAQAIGTAARHGAAPVVLVLNNDGYTVERAIHGPEATYNDVAAWDYTALPAAFGAGDRAVTDRVTTAEELNGALTRAAAAHREGRLSLVEAVLDRQDAPQLLNALCERLASQNAY